MRLTILLTLLIFAITKPYSQSYVEVKSTTSFYEKLKSISENTETIQCDFIQEKQLSFMEQAMVSKGKMYFAGTDQLRWEYTEPYSYAVLMVKDKLFIIDEGDVNQTKLGKNPAFKKVQQLMTKTLRGDFSAQDDQFDQTIEENAEYYRMTLIPRDPAMAEFISSMSLYFSKPDFIMSKFVMDENGDTTTTTLSNQQINAGIGDEVFVW